MTTPVKRAKCNPILLNTKKGPFPPKTTEKGLSGTEKVFYGFFFFFFFFVFVLFFLFQRKPQAVLGTYRISGKPPIRISSALTFDGTTIKQHYNLTLVILNKLRCHT